MYDAVSAGDLEKFFSCLDKDIVIVEPSFLPYGGRYEGLTTFQALLPKLGQYLDVSSVKLESVVADGDIVVGFVRLKATKDGSDVRIAERTVVRNGKITEIKVFFFELGAVASEIKR